MKVCSHCHAELDDEERFCPHDGTPLEASPTADDIERDSFISKCVAGRFTITGLIGEGGMGTVYHAVQTAVGRDVALKVIRREYNADERFVERFKREAQAVSRLKSPNTVTLFDFGQDDDGRLFLVMELLEGETLKERKVTRGRLPWRQALVIGRQIAESLAEAHDQGIVHRDLKPDNVFLTRGATGKELVKVVDFSIARFNRGNNDQETLTQVGTSLGTPGYMSPEQAQGRSVDGRTDLYSLGVILYELISGAPPFEADSTVILLSKHISEKACPIARRAPDVKIPRVVDAFILRLLEKSARQRPANAVDVIECIDRLLEGQIAEPETAVERPKGRVPLENSHDDDDHDASHVPDRITVAPFQPPKKSSWIPILFVVAGIAVIIGGVLGAMALFVRGGDDVGGNGSTLLEPHDEEQDSTSRAQAVDIELVASPPSATFWLDDTKLSSNPYRLTRPQSSEPHRLVVKADGYVTEERTLRFSSNSKFVITLSKIENRDPEGDADSGIEQRDRGSRMKQKRRHLPIVTIPP